MKQALQRITVEEYTTPSPVSCTPTSELSEVAKKMEKGGFRHMPVLEDKKVVGVLSDRELGIAIKCGAVGSMTVQDIMKTDPYITSPQTSVEEVVFEMSSRKIGSSIVLDEANNFIGIFTSTDALNAIIEMIRGDVECS